MKTRNYEYKICITIPTNCNNKIEEMSIAEMRTVQSMMRKLIADFFNNNEQVDDDDIFEVYKRNNTTKKTPIWLSAEMEQQIRDFATKQSLSQSNALRIIFIHQLKNI